MDFGITGKKALITGAGRGLGRAITLALYNEGVKVAPISRTKSDLENLTNEIGGKENGNYTISCDLSKYDSPRKVIEELLDNGFGYPDILVNNVGGTLDIKNPFCSIEDWRKILRLNLEVTIELSNLVIPYMKEKQWGRIVNISSISSKENQGPVTYCTAKAALNAYTRSMGRFLAPEGIVMSEVLPGAVFTEGGYWDTVSKTNPEQAKKYVDERMAIKRFGTPEEIASIVTFLCSKQSSFCIGSAFPADGGQAKCFY